MDKMPFECNIALTRDREGNRYASLPDWATAELGTTVWALPYICNDTLAHAAKRVGMQLFSKEMFDVVGEFVQGMTEVSLPDVYGDEHLLGKCCHFLPNRVFSTSITNDVLRIPRRVCSALEIGEKAVIYKLLVDVFLELR